METTLQNVANMIKPKFKLTKHPFVSYIKAKFKNIGVYERQRNRVTNFLDMIKGIILMVESEAFKLS